MNKSTTHVKYGTVSLRNGRELIRGTRVVAYQIFSKLDRKTYITEVQLN